MPAATEFLADTISQAWQAPFRGEIYEDARALNLQQGYAVKGQFDIATARHIAEPLEAIRDPRVRWVSITAAVQTLKSLIADIVVPYWLQHDPGDILWLFEDDPKAKLYAETRAMPLIKSVPAIARMLRDVDRSEKTKTKIKFAHCNLVMAGLNEGNVQSISYRYVIIDEAWMARANGLIRQAIFRTRQYPDTKKVLILGQGGYEGEDAETVHQETDQRELNYACPACGYLQPFELARLRGDDHPIAKLRGTFAGLSWDSSEITRPGGRWNFEAVARTAHHRCWACDARIEDTPTIRRQLNDSYTYRATSPAAESGKVGFHWPAEASMRIPFGELAVRYLKAKIASDELGYRLPLQEFYQKDRAVHWSDGTADEFKATIHEPYDVTSDWAEEAHRPMFVDCQRDLKKFFYSVFAVALSGEARELARGTAESFDEIAEVQKLWKVRDQQVFLDCGYEMTRVLRECVKRGHVGNVRVGKAVKKLWLCWTGLKGSGQEMFLHKHPKKPELKDWRLYSDRKFYDVNVGTKVRGPRAPWYEWSNLHCKDLLRARRDQDAGVPKFRTLPETVPNSDQWSYFAQMRSERRLEEYEGGKKRAIWKPVSKTRPNHYWDIGGMLMAFMAIVGIIGVDAGQAAPSSNQ
jgi:hypothetical protein